MPRYRADSDKLVFDPRLKLSWHQRLRRWFRTRAAHLRRFLPRIALTARQRRLILVVVAFVPVATLLRAGWAEWSERSGHLVAGEVKLGRNAPLGGLRLFPEESAWNTPIDDRPVDPRSDLLLSTIGLEVPLHPDFGTNRLRTRVYGIPYVVVDGPDVPGSTIEFMYADESDDGLYPIPENPPIENGGDRHVLIVDRSDWRLYELYLVSGSARSWQAGSGAIFDLGATASRPRGWTSADAAGLAILPGLARVDEAYDLAEIRHALRFTLPRTRTQFIYPARHHAGAADDPGLPPMGLRLRLKASVNVGSMPPGAQAIARALQRYGMILADNGGAMYLTGTADRRWKRRDIAALKQLTTSDFEVIVPPPPPASDTVAQRELGEGRSGFSGQ